MCGLAVDIGLVHNRRIELQNMADVVALAAANELDGTALGVTHAMEAAGTAARTFSYHYTTTFTWKDEALQFATSPGPGAAWSSGGAAKGTPDGMFYAKVETQLLDDGSGTVVPVFFQAIAPAQAITLAGHAIAGRMGVRVAPLAICALSKVAGESRASSAGNELVEFGFRRGVAYDLMQLNFDGPAPENFVVNPFAPVGTLGTAAPTESKIVGPYVCSGTLAIPRVTSRTGPDDWITVVRPFPLASLANHLNTRFDKSAGSDCSAAAAAPPDFNVKAFTFGAGTTWMKVAPAGQGAAPLAEATRLATVADRVPTPAGTTAPMFGPLWSYAKAVLWESYKPGQPEPAAGYATFGTGAWPTLYNPGGPVASSYPSATPYGASSPGNANFQAPPSGLRGLRNRRVLNVPLLSCPVAAGSPAAARVLGIGKFFMTVPATPTTLFAEFAGTLSDQALGTAAVLFP